MTFSNTTTKLARIAFAMAALSISSTALADERTQSHTVHYYDLNLANEADVDELDRRLDRAVKQVCGRASGLSLQQRRLVGTCHDEARNGVTPQREFAIAQAGSQRDQLAARANGLKIRIVSEN